MIFIRVLVLMFFLVGFAASAMAQATHASYRLSLQDSLQRADELNLQVMMASARLEEAIARISQAQSDLLPHIDGTLNGGRETSDLRAEGLQIPIPGFSTHVGPYNTFDARARVTVAIFDPSAFERFKAARKGENLSRAELEKTREDVLALVATLFVDAERKQETANLLKTLLDRDQMAYELSNYGYSEGTGTLLDSNKSKTDLDQTKYLYIQAKLQAEDARLDLVAALQLPTNMPLVFVDDVDFIKTLQKMAAINSNQASNADMVLASSTLEARQADQKSAYADFLPKVSGSADYGRSGESPQHGSNTYFVGLQASVPIWDGGAQQAQLKEVKGQIKEAKENLQDTTEQAQVNIAKARAAIVEANDLKEAKAQKRLTSQRSLRIAVHSQVMGNGTVFEVMQAKADLAMAEDEYNEAQSTWMMAHIDLLHAQGQLRQLVKQQGE